MKSTVQTGVIRRIDDLGRIVISKSIREQLNIQENDPFEISADENGRIILTKYNPNPLVHIRTRSNYFKPKDLNACIHFLKTRTELDVWQHPTDHTKIAFGSDHADITLSDSAMQEYYDTRKEYGFDDEVLDTMDLFVKELSEQLDKDPVSIITATWSNTKDLQVSYDIVTTKSHTQSSLDFTLQEIARDMIDNPDWCMDAGY